MRRVKLVIAYDGTDFHGWQRQRDVRTVQQEVEDLARRVIGEPVNLVAASRTDAGVHAQGQTVHVQYEGPIPARNLRRAINHRLPDDVTILAAREVPPRFHATRCALGKLYRYTIYNAFDRPEEPAQLRRAWHVWHAIDVENIRAAARLMTGTHDFAAFASQGSPRETTVRTVSRIAIRLAYRTIVIDVEGDGFLYNQVRNMVGTLVEVGRGHWPPERVSEILASCDRAQAGPTAPPQGLCLQWVKYPPDAELLPWTSDNE